MKKLTDEIDYNSLKEKYHNIFLTSDIVSLDFETTGFSPYKFSKIIEVGAVKYNDEQNVFSELINPGSSIPKKVTELTGIKKEDVVDKDSYPIVISNLVNFIPTNFTIIAHNAKFEKLFLEYFKNKLGYKKEYDYVDTLNLFKVALPNLDSWNLGNLLSLFNIEQENWHRAPDDALFTLKLFKKLQKLYLEHFGISTNLIKEEPVYFSTESALVVSESNWETNKLSRKYYNIITRKVPLPGSQQSIFKDNKTDTWDVKGNLDVPIDWNEFLDNIKDVF